MYTSISHDCITTLRTAPQRLPRTSVSAVAEATGRCAPTPGLAPALEAEPAADRRGRGSGSFAAAAALLVRLTSSGGAPTARLQHRCALGAGGTMSIKRAFLSFYLLSNGGGSRLSHSCDCATGRARNVSAGHVLPDW